MNDMIPAYMAHEALKRLRDEPWLCDLGAGLGRRDLTGSRQVRRANERVLRAEGISMILGLTALIGGLGVPAAAAGAIGGAIIGLGVSFAPSVASRSLGRMSRP